MQPKPEDRELSNTEWEDLIGKDEMNLAEFPITLLTDRAEAGQTTIERHIEVFDDRIGKLVSRKVTVTGSEKYGIPTAKDNLILLGLIYISKRANNFTDRRVRFNRSELIRVLDWPDTGPYYMRIQTSLCRWSNVFVLWENSWWEKSKQGYSTKGFGIIDDFELNDGNRSEQMGLFKSNFAWNDVFFSSLQAGFVRSLDLRLLLRLKHPTSQQMYRYLGKHFYSRRELTLDLKPFACEHVGLGRNYSDNGKIKEKLQPAIEELEAIGFLQPMSREERYTKVSRGEWKITLVRSEQPKASRGEEPEEAKRSELEGALISRGITPATAAELVSSHTPEHIQERIEMFDWLSSKKDKRVSKSPAGYLAESIRKSYTPPKGFQSKAEQERKRAAEAEQRRKAEEAKKRAEAEQKAREEAEQARIRAYFDSLSPEEQERLRADALANANSFFMQQYRRNENDPAISGRYLKLIIDTHISSLLASQELRTGTDG